MSLVPWSWSRPRTALYSDVDTEPSGVAGSSRTSGTCVRLVWWITVEEMPMTAKDAIVDRMVSVSVTAKLPYSKKNGRNDVDFSGWCLSKRFVQRLMI